jgi:hypothetical protein
VLLHGDLLEYIQSLRNRKLIMCPSADGADNNLTDQTEQFDAAAGQAAPPGGVTIEKKCLPVAGGDGTLIMCHQRACPVPIRSTVLHSMGTDPRNRRLRGVSRVMTRCNRVYVTGRPTIGRTAEAG